ncbi:hypothetical protein ACH5RR_008568 [Cinchona calisaya]|uniref:Uncharacterized protein n=1 Tax=Cinchona calisaya TaxID=153742 RepID=A0ABD3ABQ7_9GENT
MREFHGAKAETNFPQLEVHNFFKVKFKNNCFRNKSPSSQSSMAESSSSEALSSIVVVVNLSLLSLDLSLGGYHEVHDHERQFLIFPMGGHFTRVMQQMTMNPS